jgi:hypothetical protein
LSSISSSDRRSPIRRGREAGPRIRPLEGRPLGGHDDVARHREAEPSRRGYAVDGGDKRLRRAPDLRDRAVQVLEDLLEHFSEPARHSPPVRREISQPGIISTAADVLEIGATAEHPAGAGEDDGAYRGVPRHLERGAPEILRGRDVERVEAGGAIDRNSPHRTGAIDADV